jgi:hypothetical protein
MVRGRRNFEAMEMIYESGESGLVEEPGVIGRGNGYIQLARKSGEPTWVLNLLAHNFTNVQYCNKR